MRGSDFEFDGVNFLYYDFNEINLNRSGSYIDSPKWLKDKKSTINPKNNDGKCFQNAVTLALNLDNIQDNIQNNPNESSTTEINKYTPSGYSIFTHCSFDQTKNKLDHYRGKGCMKKFSKDLRDHATKIINYETKKMISLRTEEKIYHNEQEICYICKKVFDEKNYKVRDHCCYTGKYRGGAHNMYNLK